MNAQRRREIDKLVADLQAMQAGLQADVDLKELAGSLSDAYDACEDIRDAEQDAFDNMPEGFQQGERGQQSEEAIANLQAACDALTEAQEACDGIEPETDLEELAEVIAGHIDDAIGCLNEASA